MERVKRLRENLGLTQEAFAERAGLKYKHYQAVEAGRKTNIQFATLIKLAEACEVKPWQFLYFEGDVSSASPAIAEPKGKYHVTKTPKTLARSKSKRRSG